MHVRNPRRILFFSGPDSGVLSFIKDLTGSAPEPRSIPAARPSSTPASEQSAETQLGVQTTTAGLTHTLPLKTKYYSADIPVWLDETSDAGIWRDDFFVLEAAEVVKAVGAWVVVFRQGAAGAAEHARGLMRAVNEVVERAHGGEGVWDGVLLAVGLGGMGQEGGEEDWEDACLDLGFEYVNCSGIGRRQGRSESGQREGLERIREALEANEWEAVDEDELDALGIDEVGFGASGESTGGSDTGFGIEEAQMEQEFAGLKMAMEKDNGGVGTEDDEAFQVDEMERMMGKMMAVRDMTAHMPEQERKRFAARTVNEIMQGS